MTKTPPRPDTASDAPALAAALAREAAQSEILRLIQTSREDERPVFDAILHHAHLLCDAPFAALVLAQEGDATQRMVAGLGAEASTQAFYDAGQVPMDPDRSFAARAILEARTIHLPDMVDTDEYRRGVSNVVQLAETQNIRTNLFVPLILGKTAVGCFILFRKDVRPFADDQIALVESFAAHAVIAIENARQFREVQTRLDRERALAKVLHVISQSRDDTVPVFDTILDSAARLCDARHAMLLMRNAEGTHLDMVASNSAKSAFVDQLRDTPHEIDGGQSYSAQVLHSKELLHIDDMLADMKERGVASQTTLAAEIEGIRSLMILPLLLEDEALGVICLYKLEVAPFSEDEIALLRSFADQAVIAIENVRQFREVQGRLERERASSDVLSVISQSRDDELPVFHAILESASRLCDAPIAFLSVANAERTLVKIPAYRGTRSEFGDILADFEEPITRSELVAVRPIVDGKILRQNDITDDDTYRTGDLRRRQMADVEGARSVLCVPLLKDGVALGAIVLYRREIAPFSDDDVALVQNFAAQAVIAIENVRQFREVQTLNAELGDRVEAQVGELERMGRLKRFLPEQVADAVVSSGDDAMLSSHRALIAALFCDIRGFTAFCETAEPEETIEVLQTYHEEMGKLISAHGAGVDHRAGDGIMVLFNDPLPCDDPAGDALRLAFAMRATMQDLCKRWRKLGHRLGFGVGISLGYATVGMVGSEGRFHYTASGTAVNLAARLCDMAADGEILLSPRAWIAVEEETTGELVGAVEIKGISAPVEVYRALAPTG